MRRHSREWVPKTVLNDMRQLREEPQLSGAAEPAKIFLCFAVTPTQENGRPGPQALLRRIGTKMTNYL
jgi:hypothetical protein